MLSRSSTEVREWEKQFPTIAHGRLRWSKGLIFMYSLILGNRGKKLKTVSYLHCKLLYYLIELSSSFSILSSKRKTTVPSSCRSEATIHSLRPVIFGQKAHCRKKKKIANTTPETSKHCIKSQQGFGACLNQKSFEIMISMGSFFPLPEGFRCWNAKALTLKAYPVEKVQCESTTAL